MEPVVFCVPCARHIVVDEVAVEIDIVLGYAPKPGKAVRVDGMNQHQPNVVGEGPGLARGEQSGQHARSAEAFDAVGRRVE